MKRISFVLVFVFGLLLWGGIFTSCSSEKDSPEVDTFDVDFILPAGIESSKEGLVTFVVNDGKAPASTDVMFFTESTGISRSCSIVETSPASFSIKLSKGIVDGDYMVALKRGARRKEFGKTHVSNSKESRIHPS